MKSQFGALVLLASSLALGQTATPATQATQPVPGTQAAAQAGAKELPPDTPVITIYDLCKEKLANFGECKTVVTRAQFDRVLESLGQQQAPPDMKRELANRYSQVLIFATEAEKQGIENRPEMQEFFRLARIHTLAQAMQKVLQQRVQVSPDDVQKFYNEKKANLIQLSLQRVIVPVRDKAGEPEMKKFADSLQQRAVTGADFKALQAEAYQKAGMQNPPETRLLIRPGQVPLEQRAILELKPGQTSAVIKGEDAFYIYKLDSQEPIPLAVIQNDVKAALVQQKIQQETQLLLNTARPSLNPDYFGPISSGPGEPPTGGEPGKTAPNTPAQQQ